MQFRLNLNFLYNSLINLEKYEAKKIDSATLSKDTEDSHKLPGWLDAVLYGLSIFNKIVWGVVGLSSVLGAPLNWTLILTLVILICDVFVETPIFKRTLQEFLQCFYHSYFERNSNSGDSWLKRTIKKKLLTGGLITSQEAQKPTSELSKGIRVRIFLLMWIAPIFVILNTALTLPVVINYLKKADFIVGSKSFLLPNFIIWPCVVIVTILSCFFIYAVFFNALTMDFRGLLKKLVGSSDHLKSKWPLYISRFIFSLLFVSLTVAIILSCLATVGAYDNSLQQVLNIHHFSWGLLIMILVFIFSINLIFHMYYGFEVVANLLQFIRQAKNPIKVLKKWYKNFNKENDHLSMATRILKLVFYALTYLVLFALILVVFLFHLLRGAIFAGEGARNDPTNIFYGIGRALHFSAGVFAAGIAFIVEFFTDVYCTLSGFFRRLLGSSDKAHAPRENNVVSQSTDNDNEDSPFLIMMDGFSRWFNQALAEKKYLPFILWLVLIAAFSLSTYIVSKAFLNYPGLTRPFLCAFVITSFGFFFLFKLLSPFMRHFCPDLWNVFSGKTAGKTSLQIDGKLLITPNSKILSVSINNKVDGVSDVVNRNDKDNQDKMTDSAELSYPKDFFNKIGN